MAGAWRGPGWRARVTAGSRPTGCSWLGTGGGRGGQAAAVPQTVTTAGAVRVVMSRGAAGKAYADLVFRSRCRSRSTVMRQRLAAAVMPRLAAAVIAGGRLAVAAPERTEAM